MNTLRQVLYFSRARASIADSDVRQILWISQRNNRKSDITGCLLYSGRHFAQALEGDSLALDDVLARIRKDERHGEFVLALDRVVSSRKFPQWSMGILYKAHLAEFLEALISGKSVSDAEVLDLLAEMNPDTVMGAL